MKRVKQKDKSGCGLACIAMLSRLPYKEVRRLAISELGLDSGGEFYTSTGQLRRLAAKCGVTINDQRRRKFKGWKHLPAIAIVSINPKENGRFWHWVIFMRKNEFAFVLDPKNTIKSRRRTDLGRMKPNGFLAVELIVT